MKTSTMTFNNRHARPTAKTPKKPNGKSATAKRDRGGRKTPVKTEPQVDPTITQAVMLLDRLVVDREIEGCSAGDLGTWLWNNGTESENAEALIAIAPIVDRAERRMSLLKEKILRSTSLVGKSGKKRK